MIEEPTHPLPLTSLNNIFEIKQNESENDTGIGYLKNDQAQTQDRIKDHESFDDGFLLDYLIKNEDEEKQQQQPFKTEINGQICIIKNNLKTCSPATNNVDSENEEPSHYNNVFNEFVFHELSASRQVEEMSHFSKYVENSIQEISRLKPINSSHINNHLNLNLKMIDRIAKTDYFTLKISHKPSLAKTNNLKQSESFIIESISENVSQFLNLSKDELTGKCINELINSSDHNKLQDLFNLFTDTIATPEWLKPRLFICQILCPSKVNHSNSSDQNNSLKDLNFFEDVVFIPINTSRYLESTSITFAVKKFKKSQSIVKSRTAQISSSVSSNLRSIQVSAGIFKNPNNDINMDQFKTKMTGKGVIFSAETCHLKSSFFNSSTQAINGKSGLISDLKMDKPVNIFEYVHCNDQNHIMQHIQNVLKQNENTSAIYRLKINEKYAFLQTQSKIVSTKSDEEPIICSIHSIIKEIDTDVELKGNASTSLMKTLISKKPSLVTPTSKSPGQLNNIIESLAIEEQTGSIKIKESELISPNERRRPSSPIGTKFALSMLGLTSSLQRNDSIFSITETETSKSPIDFNIDNICQIENKDRSVESKRKKQNDDDNNNNSSEIENQNKVSMRKNNALLKKLLSEGNQDQNDLDLYLENQQRQDETFFLTQPSMASSPITSPIANPSPGSNSNNDKVSKTKCDIILRTLLNTSDIEPQILTFESVFDLNNNSRETLNRQQEQKNHHQQQQRKEESLFCETQNQHSPTFKASIRNASLTKRQKIKSEDSLNSPSASIQISIEPRKRKKTVKPSKDASLELSPLLLDAKNTSKKSVASKATNPKRNNPRSNNVVTHSPINNSSIVYETAHGNNLNVYEPQQQQHQHQVTNSQLEKASYSNYLNKENDLIEQQQQKYGINQNYLSNNICSDSSGNISVNSQPNRYLNNFDVNPSAIKKLRIDMNSQQNFSMYQNHFNVDQNQQASLHHSNARDNYSFPSSLASSNISVSSSSSLSSPCTNALNGISNGGYAENLFIQNQEVYNSNNNNNNACITNHYLSLTDEFIDDFNTSQPTLSNHVTHTGNDILNELDSIADFNVKTTGLSIIADTNNNTHTPPTIPSLNESNTRNKINIVSNNTSGLTPNNEILKEDEITKKKRIEAISKHLKFDLESFKSAQSSNNNNTNVFYEGSIQNSSNSVLTTRQPHSQLYHNESFDQDLNSSFASTNCLSPISIASIKLTNNDSHTPNITIEPGGFAKEGNSRYFQMISTSNTSVSNKNPELISSNKNSTIYYSYPHQATSSSLSPMKSSYVSLNQTSTSGDSSQYNSFKNDPAQNNLRKKLQERIQRNTTQLYQMDSNNLNSPNSQSYYNNSQHDISPQSLPFVQTNFQAPVNNIGIQYNSPGSSFTTQTSFIQPHLPTTSELSHNVTSVKGNLGLDVASYSSFNNYSSSSPIYINSNMVGNNFPASDILDAQKNLKSYGSGDFVKKQLGNTVNKRINQQTKQPHLTPYGYNNEQDMSTSMPSTDMHGNIQQHSLNNNQHQSQYYQQNSQQFYPHTVSSPGNISKQESTDQIHLTASKPSFGNQYHSGNTNQFNQNSSYHNSFTANDNMQLYEKSQGFSLLGSSYKNQQHSNNLNYHNNQMSTVTNNQPKQQLSLSQQYQQPIRNTNEIYNLNTNNTIEGYEGGYLNEDSKGSLLQQLLLD